MALLALAVLAPAQKPAAKFNPPDGHWWLNATREQRNGFLIGYFDCHTFMLRKEVLSGPPGEGLLDAVSEAYDKGDQSTAVASVIQALLERWRREGRYHIIRADPSSEFDGLIWMGGSVKAAYRLGIIEGFLACQAANRQLPNTATPSVLEHRVSSWYGTGSEETVASRHYNDKLGAVIMRAEKGPVRTGPAARHREGAPRPGGTGTRSRSVVGRKAQ